MAGYNKVILLGNLTRDPEVKYLPSGTAVANFGLATNRVWNDRQTGEQKSEVCFVDISAFGRSAEICGEYLQKGRPVLIEGRLRFNSWETEDGQKRSKLDVVAENVRLLPRGGDSSGGSMDTSSDTGQAASEDDIPF
jgi:single-strand DNA-binding protein